MGQRLWLVAALVLLASTVVGLSVAGCGGSGEMAAAAGDHADAAQDAAQGDAQPLPDSGAPSSGDSATIPSIDSASPLADATVDASPDSPSVHDATMCDPGGPPSQGACAIDESLGVFVAPSSDGGSDAGNGTRASPFATIGHALSNLGGKSRVFLCNATFAERVTVTLGVSLYGGLACPNGDAGSPWSYVGGHAVILGP